MRHYGARVTDRFRLDDLRTVIVENQLLRLVFVPGRGCDLVELLHKPSDVDFLWRSPLAAVRDSPAFVPTSHGKGPFLDYYRGGWQELFPHASLATEYAGAELGVHGEVWGLPWDHTIVKDDAGEVAVRFSVRTVRSPFLLERTVRLRSGEPIVRFEERVVNEGMRALEFMWGHHPAFGPPFLDERSILDAPARRIRVGDTVLPWPIDRHGRDHRRIVPDGSSSEVMKYLELLRGGWVALTQPRLRLGIGLVFDPEIFPYVWLWHELGYTQDYPWFGRAYVLGVEPQSSLPAAREKGGRLLRLAAGGVLETELAAVVYEGTGVSRISPRGRVTTR
jgi:galactose mutarotase-like enzyme